MLNNVSLQGRLVANPELRHTNGGLPVTSFVLAVERAYGKDGNTTADFIECVAWKQTAEFICKYFHKADGICIDGSLQTRLYDDRSGIRHKVTEVVVAHAHFQIRAKQNGTELPQGSDSDFSQIIGDTDDLPF